MLMASSHLDVFVVTLLARTLLASVSILGPLHLLSSPVIDQ